MFWKGVFFLGDLLLRGVFWKMLSMVFLLRGVLRKFVASFPVDVLPRVVFRDGFY